MIIDRLLFLKVKIFVILPSPIDLTGHPRMITRRETFDPAMLQRSLKSSRRKSVFVISGAQYRLFFSPGIVILRVPS